MSETTGSRGRGRLIWLAPAVAFMLVLAPIALLAGAGNECATTSAGGPTAGSSNPGAGGFEETAYGPPWGGINGGGVTAIGITSPAASRCSKSPSTQESSVCAATTTSGPTHSRATVPSLLATRRRDHRPAHRHL